MFDFTSDTGSTGTARVVTLVSPTLCSQQDSATQEHRTDPTAQLAQENKANAQMSTDTARQRRCVWSVVERHNAKIRGLMPNNSWSASRPRGVREQQDWKSATTHETLHKHLGNNAKNHLPGQGTEHKCKALSSAKAKAPAVTETVGRNNRILGLYKLNHKGQRAFT